MRQFACYFLLMGGIVFAAPVPKDPKIVDLFPIKEGSTWEYSVADTQKKDQTEEKVTISKVTKKGDEITAIEAGRGAIGGKGVEIKANPKGITFSQSNAGTSMEWTIWKPGAKKGDTWTNKIEFGGIGGGAGGPNINADMNTEVGGIEEIKVPGGKFNAQLVTTTVTISLAGMQNISLVMKVWLADGVGIVRTETTTGGLPGGIGASRVTELKKYTPGK